MISPSCRSANVRPSALLPDAVGPRMARTRGRTSRALFGHGEDVEMLPQPHVAAVEFLPTPHVLITFEDAITKHPQTVVIPGALLPREVPVDFDDLRVLGYRIFKCD